MADDRLKTLEERTRYEPADVEGRVFARWEQAGIFHPEPEGTPDENYSIAVPPPNVTGNLHMGHALNASIQDLKIRVARMRGQRAKWIFGKDHAGIATQRVVEQQLEAEGISREEIGREAFVERVWEWVEEYGGNDQPPVPRARRLARLRGRALHDGPRLRARGDEGVRAPVREGARLPRQLHGQLGPGAADGDLRPRGGAAQRRGHALRDRLPARVGLRLAHDRDGAPGDDARRHRDRGEPLRRALLAADRRGGDPAAGRPPAADHRRRLRGPRVRHRRAEDHAGPRPERLRDRPQARARGGHGDRRGRPHHRRRAGALPRDGDRTRPRRRSWPSCASRG